MLFAGPYISFDVMQLILVVLLVIGVVATFIVDRFLCRIDPPPKKVLEEKDVVQSGSNVKLVPLQVATYGDSSSIPSSPAPTPPASPAPQATT